MEDFDSMPALEMLARREAAEVRVSIALGKLVFSYSRFVTALHLCVAWHDNGKKYDRHRKSASDLCASDLLRKIEERMLALYKPGTRGFKNYTAWLARANEHRVARNTVFHSRWGIEAFGRHAIAVITPVVVTPVVEQIFPLDDLDNLHKTSDQLAAELSQLRDAHPL